MYSSPSHVVATSGSETFAPSAIIFAPLYCLLLNSYHRREWEMETGGVAWYLDLFACDYFLLTRNNRLSINYRVGFLILYGGKSFGHDLFPSRV